MSVALPHCTTPPLVLLHVETCPAQSLSVYTFTNFECLMISIKLFALGTPCKCRTIRFRFISSVSVGHVIFLAVSFTLYMMSARSGTCTTIFPQLFSTLLVFHLPTQRAILSLASSSHLESSLVLLPPNQEYSSHLDVLRIRFYRISSCRSLNHSAQEINFVTCLLHSSCDSHQNLL